MVGGEDMATARGAATSDLTPVPESHITLDQRGVAWIRGANTKVKEVVLDKLVYGLDPEAIHREHPHLSLAQIHAALSYYYDHQAALDAEMASDLQEADRLALEAVRSPLRQRLRALGKLP